MQLFGENGPKYVRLDDDVSFQILRTNPKLTTNTKLMYDGENLYMDSYSAVPLLSTMEYKHHRVWKTGLFNRDIRNFLLGTNTAAYEVGQTVNDTIMLDSYDDQFENMYWCGVESINSKVYPQEMGCIAPLYLRKKRPNYFVIFKINNPANTNTSPDANDRKFEFNVDIQNKMQIVKAFDLREGTPIGNYIKRYVEQRDFKYDQSIYVNFSSHEIYYYGIDKKSGVLTEKVENFEEQLLKNDNTIMKMDDWITEGFERSNLIFPYIINLEFLFDDKDIEEYKFARYFGMYCNDIDLYDVNINGSVITDAGYTVLTSDWREEDHITMDIGKFYYLKDKYGNIFTAGRSVIPGHYRVPGTVSVEQFTGFEPSTVSTYAERIPGTGKSIMILEIDKPLGNGDTVMFTKLKYEEEMDGSDLNIDMVEEIIASFTATNQIGKGESIENGFSCRGNLNDMAKALASAVRICENESLQWVTAFNIDNKVIIRAIYPGINMNGIFDVSLDQIITSNEKIIKLTDSFKGGTNYDGCMFKVNASDKDMFFDRSGNDRDSARYLKCGSGEENTEILTVIPYIVDDEKIDDNYMVIITDNNGRYANVSRTNQIEIMDRYYTKLGMLSFFPVKDFDFDTVYSAYGEYSQMKKELDAISKYIGGEKFSIPYSRFFYDNNAKADTEYDYFFENYLPELTTIDKTIPFINKWGYADDAKDSCENPYRLNTSKIFEACNFSANTFVQSGDIMEYTHSMPYYVNSGNNKSEDDLRNEYHYLDISDIMEEYSLGSNLEDWIEYFSKETNDKKDPFTKMFGDTSKTIYTSKRFNKKYSRFLTGNTVNRSSTMFRGMKFEVVELVNGKEVHTGKYNDYRFSFIYVPVNIDKDNDKHTVNFIKNDEFKFIVGIVFFNMEDDFSSNEFNKAYVYSNSMGFNNIINEHGTSSGGGENEQGEEIKPEWIQPSGGNVKPEDLDENDQSSSFRQIMFKTNRRNTMVNFWIESSEGDKLVREMSVVVPVSNKYYSVYDDYVNKLRTGDIVKYYVTISENGTVKERIPDAEVAEYLEYTIDGNTAQKIDVEFSKTLSSQYYMKVVNTEKNTATFGPVAYDSSEPFVFNIETNIEYDVRIVSKGSYGFFTVDGETCSKALTMTNLSGDKNISFGFSNFEIQNPGSNLKPSDMYRDITVYVDVPDKYKDDVRSKEFIIRQNSNLADAEQTAEITMDDNTKNGFLNGLNGLMYNEGQLTFNIKPDCCWYISSEIDENSGISNPLTFSPASGNPSNTNILITATWNGGIAKPDKKRTILMKVCSTLTDEVICKVDASNTGYTHKWEILPSVLNTNPSGENDLGNCPPDSYKDLDASASSVLAAFVGCGKTNTGELYPNNRLEVYKEATTIYLYVKSNVSYKLERNLLPSYATVSYYRTLPDREELITDVDEFGPGQRIFKVDITENEVTRSRQVDVQFTSVDSGFEGSTVAHIIQKETSRGDDNVYNQYVLVKEGNEWKFKGTNDSFVIEYYNGMKKILG